MLVEARKNSGPKAIQQKKTILQKGSNSDQVKGHQPVEHGPCDRWLKSSPRKRTRWGQTNVSTGYLIGLLEPEVVLVLELFLFRQGSFIFLEVDVILIVVVVIVVVDFIVILKRYLERSGQRKRQICPKTKQVSFQRQKSLDLSLSLEIDQESHQTNRSSMN